MQSYHTATTTLGRQVSHHTSQPSVPTISEYTHSAWTYYLTATNYHWVLHNYAQLTSHVI